MTKIRMKLIVCAVQSAAMYVPDTQKIRVFLKTMTNLRSRTRNRGNAPEILLSTDIS